jgi:hypothetical protein
VRAALAAGQALSCKLHKVEGHWRLLMSFNRIAAPVTTLEAKFGRVGGDFNADHLGVAQTDLYGNISKRGGWSCPLPRPAPPPAHCSAQQLLREVQVFGRRRDDAYRHQKPRIARTWQVHDRRNEAGGVQHHFQASPHQHAIRRQGTRKVEFGQPLHAEATQYSLLLALLGVSQDMEVVSAPIPRQLGRELRNGPSKGFSSTPKRVLRGQPSK